MTLPVKLDYTTTNSMNTIIYYFILHRFLERQPAVGRGSPPFLVGNFRPKN